MSVDSGPNTGSISEHALPNLGKFGRFRANLDRFWANAVRTWPTSGLGFGRPRAEYLA